MGKDSILRTEYTKYIGLTIDETNMGISSKWNLQFIVEIFWNI